MKFKTFTRVLKLNHFMVFVFLILLLGASSCSIFLKKEVTIHGKIIGEEISEVIYSKPLNGICYWGFADTVKVDSFGNYLIEVNASRATFMKFRINKERVDLIVEPGEEINLDYDFTNNTNPLKIKCKNEKGQILLNQLPNPTTLRLSGLTKFLDDLDIKAIKEELSLRFENELTLIETLFEDGEISKDFHKLIFSDRVCYYEGLKATHAQRKFMKVGRKDISLFPSEMKAFWNDIFVQFPVTNPDMFYSRWWHDYATNFLHNKEYLANEFNVEELIKIHENGEIHTHNLNIAKEHLEDDFLELYSAIYIKDAAIQKDYEKELITLYEDFTKSFPKSLYSGYISNQVQPIVGFHKAQEDNFKIDLLEYSDSISTLNDCIKQFEGKPLFIDVWASWCGPCKKEFDSNTKLKELLRQNGFELLYISIDDDRRKENWQEMIRGYKLEGKHIRANHKLVSDLRRIFNKNGSISIPWYLIVNENGKIINEHAPRPSELEKLAKQLSAVKTNQ